MASSLPQMDSKKWGHEMRIKKTHDTVLHRGVLDFGKLENVAGRLVGAMATKRGEAHGCSKTSSCPSLALKRTSQGENAVSHLVSLVAWSLLAWTWKGMALQRPVSFHYQSFGKCNLQFHAVSIFFQSTCVEGRKTEHWQCVLCFSGQLHEDLSVGSIARRQTACVHPVQKCK